MHNTSRFVQDVNRRRKRTPDRRPKGTPLRMWICRAAVGPAAVGGGAHSSAGGLMMAWPLEGVRRGF